MTVTEQMFAPLADPFDRFSQALRRDGRQRIFAVGKQLSAESATDIRCNDPHFIGRQLHHPTNDVTNDMTALAAERKRVTLTVIFSDDTARIEIIGDETLIDDVQLDNFRSFLEGLFDAV